MRGVGIDGQWPGAVQPVWRRAVTAAAFIRYALARFNRDRCFGAAGALSYTALVSLVPLGVIALGILSIFPTFAAVREQLLAVLFRDFVPTIGEQAAHARP